MQPWHHDPLLQGRFHPQYPDDLEAHFVLMEHKTVEKMWVRLDKAAPRIGYEAVLLNTSHLVPALAANARVLVRPSRSHPPLMWIPNRATTDNLLMYSSVCQSCGFDLLFIPVADLFEMQFPNTPPGAEMVSFTTRCLMCRQAMVVERLEG